MQDGQIRITKIVFDAYGRECSETFYNKDTEECKLYIWKYLCNTAVLKSIVEKYCDYKVVHTNTITSNELTMLRYQPVVLDLIEMLKEHRNKKA